MDDFGRWWGVRLFTMGVPLFHTPQIGPTKTQSHMLFVNTFQVDRQLTITTLRPGPRCPGSRKTDRMIYPNGKASVACSPHSNAISRQLRTVVAGLPLFSILQRGLEEVPRQENARYAFTITRRKIKGYLRASSCCEHERAGSSRSISPGTGEA